MSKVTAFGEDFEDKGPLWPEDQPRRYFVEVTKPDGTVINMIYMAVSVEDALNQAHAMFDPVGWPIGNAWRDI